MKSKITMICAGVSIFIVTTFLITYEMIGKDLLKTQAENEQLKIKIERLKELAK